MPAKIIITEELKNKVKTLYGSGLGSRDIAKELHISRPIIRNIYVELGVNNIRRKKPPREYKECKDCKKEKPISDFSQKIDKRGCVIYYTICLDCQTLPRIDCGKSKLPQEMIDEILKLNGQGLGTRSICKILGPSRGSIQKVLHQNNIDNKDRGTPKRPFLEKEKLCKGCLITKPIIDFDLINNGNGKFSYRYCKECEDIKKISSKFISDLCAYVKWQVPIASHILNTLNILEFTVEEFKLNIESKMENWMNWNNHGRYKVKNWKDDDLTTWKWQIDHIVPHSLFKYSSIYDEEFKKCWSLENLRPYQAKQNLLDGVKRVRHNVI